MLEGNVCPRLLHRRHSILHSPTTCISCCALLGSPLLKADLEKIGEKDKYGVDHGTTFDGEPNQIPFIHEFGSSIILAEQHKADVSGLGLRLGARVSQHPPPPSNANLM